MPPAVPVNLFAAAPAKSSQTGAVSTAAEQVSANVQTVAIAAQQIAARNKAEANAGEAVTREPGPTQPSEGAR